MTRNSLLLSIKNSDGPSSGMMFFQIIGSFAEFEKNRINERMADGKRAKVKRGGFTAGTIPYGFTQDVTGNIIIDGDAAAQVKQIFQLRKDGLSYRKIAVKVFGDERKYGTIRYILKNPAYIGKFRQESSEEISVPRIVSPQLWNKANR